MKHFHHHYRSATKRAIFSFAIILVVMTIGTIGMHLLEDMPYLKAYYFMSMLATAQGPVYTPSSTAGIIFASLMAFISTGAVLASLGFLFGPFLGKLFRIGSEKMEDKNR
jgi:hypothetical protein